MVTWTTSTNYLDRQASAFLAGQIPLLEKPPAALVGTCQSLPVSENRAGISGYIWDASLYKGKYILLLGSCPSLAGNRGQGLAPGLDIQDQFTIFFLECRVGNRFGSFFLPAAEKNIFLGCQAGRFWD